MITQKQFLDLLKPLQSGLFGFAYRMLQNREDAKDALQELIYRLWKKRKELKQNENIRSYCFTMMHHLCIDQLRQRSHAGNHRETVLQNPVPEPVAQNPGYETTDLINHIRKEVHNLPYKQRVIIELHDFQEFNYAEIAKIMDMGVNAVRVNLSRARAKVALKFEKEKYHEPK